MTTKVFLQSKTRSKTFTVNGNPADIADKITRIKRSLKIRITHGTQKIEN